jgi:two-component system NtrC family sensor kinase
MIPIIILLFITCLTVIITLFFFYKKEKSKSQYFQRALDAKNQRHDTTITDKITLSKKQLETAFDAITDLICALDADLRITRVNKSYAAFVGVPIPKLLGKHCWEAFWKRTEPCDNCPALMTFATGKPVLKHQIKMPDSERPRYFTIATYPVFDAAGKTQNVIEHTRDSTEEKVILEQLIRSEKLASIGTMTAGIAHEMINPLSGISGTAANLLQMPDKYGLNDKGVARVTTILDSSSRASAIVKDLLHLSRKEDGTSMLTDANSLVMKAVEAVRLKGFPPVEQSISLDKSVSRVLCDPTKIQQVIINLVTNALQSVLEKKSAMARDNKQYSGLILIATHEQDGMVRIDVSDNGTGVPDAIKGKIFDPFFTTRPPGEGTGLGLSICQKIIDEHQGRIFFESTKERTTFSILLPSYAKPGAQEDDL